MRTQLRTFILSVLAGLAIGIGGTAFLAVENRVAGSLLFSVGLYTICIHGLNLFTGKVGYLPEEKPAYLGFLFNVWLGNLAGTGLIGTALRFTRMEKLADTAAALCRVKTEDSLTSLFLLAVFCGLLMFVAVDGYRRVQNPLILLGCVAAFILCGFEHCIADMFYFSVGGCWSPRAVLCILVITLGNALGGMLIPLARKLTPGEKKA